MPLTRLHELDMVQQVHRSDPIFEYGRKLFRYAVKKDRLETIAMVSKSLKFEKCF